MRGKIGLRNPILPRLKTYGIIRKSLTRTFSTTDYAGRTNLFPSVAVASKTPINDENPCRSRIERTAFFCRGENLTERPQPASASRGVFMTVPTIPRERISSKNFTVCSRLRKAININFSISTSIFMYPIWSAYMPFDVLYSCFENRVTFAFSAYK